jgi:hypothetical protein
MRKTSYSKNKMTRLTCLVFFVVLLLTLSCSGKKSDQDKQKIIPEKDLISILTEIHLADGLLILPQINKWASSLDSITSYIQIIEKHGYTKDMMDKTMKYYFVNNPKQLSKIYDQVLVILSEMESRTEKESLVIINRGNNKWPGKEFYSIPGLAGIDSTVFDITLYKSGYYTLTFTTILFPDDLSFNPRPLAFTCSPDSIDNGKREYIRSVEFIKDGRPHTYKLFFTLPEGKISHLRGWLFNYDNRPYGFYKHVTIENIMLTSGNAPE